MSNAHSLQQPIINAIQVSIASNKAGDIGHMVQCLHQSHKIIAFTWRSLRSPKSFMHFIRSQLVQFPKASTKFQRDILHPNFHQRNVKLEKRYISYRKGQKILRPVHFTSHFMSMHFYSSVKGIVPYAETEEAPGKQFHAAFSLRFTGPQKSSEVQFDDVRSSKVHHLWMHTIN